MTSSDFPSKKVPTGLVYRIAHGPDPFEPVPWRYALNGRRFTGRWDDPSGDWGAPEEDRYRVICCASEQVGAFEEKLSRYIRRGRIPTDWNSGGKYLLGKTRLIPDLLFADIAEHEALHIIRRANVSGLKEAVDQIEQELEQIAKNAGLMIAEVDIDSSLLTGIWRDPTQIIGRYIYELQDKRGKPMFDGIRYYSRFGPMWECWAVFIDKDRPLRHYPEPPEPIPNDHPGLLQIAAHYKIPPP